MAEADRQGDAADAGGFAPVSDPGSWNRFCTRAVQRWPLVLGGALVLGVPAAVVGYGQGQERWAAEARVEVQPQTLAAGSGPASGDAVVPAEALGVASLLQREARLLSDLAADNGLDSEVRARPPFGLVAAVGGDSPDAATAAAGALLDTYTRKTRLKMPEQVAIERVALDEQERALEETRAKLSASDLEIARAESELAGTAEPAALLAAEVSAEEANRAAERRLRGALAIGRDPLVFFAELVRREPAASDAVRDAADAATAAMGSASTGRGLAEALQAAASGVAGVLAEVADHRFVDTSDEPGAGGGTTLVRVSRLDAEAAEAAAAVRAAAANSAVAAVERLRPAVAPLGAGEPAGVGGDRRPRPRARAGRPARSGFARGGPGDGSTRRAGGGQPPAHGGARGAAGLAARRAGCALGWIAVDDRVRRGDERPWAARGLTILGTVPAVSAAAGGKTGDAEAMTEASQRRAQGEAAALADAVHAVRAMLEGRDANGRASAAAGGGSTPGLALVPDADGRTFAITSSGPGSGKTGLCLGLAASLASAGERVLLVDAAWADRPSRGEGAGGRQTLDTAAAGMGYLHPEDEDLLRHADPDEPVGLPAFLAGAELADAAMETRVPGLSLLVAGPGTLDAGRLSGRHVRRLVEAARPLHDVTLIDTSAVSVGLDALFVAVPPTAWCWW